MVKILAVIFCVIGVGLPISIGVISVGALVWSSLQYFVLAIVIFLRKNSLAIFSCVLLMLMADLLFYVIMKVDSHSGYLLILSLISTLKIFLLLPIGILYYILRNKTRM